jgi:hypothetical protein
LRVRTRQVAFAPRAAKHVSVYHGCHADAATHVLSGEPFRQSTNKYDWLGSGVYFWEYAPFRALEWARARDGDGGVVIEATITLNQCLNLLDSVHITHLQAAYAGAMKAIHAAGGVPPVNRRGTHELDRLIVDAYCDESAVVEGAPFSDGAWLLSRR